MPEPIIESSAFRAWADALPMLKRWTDDLGTRADNHWRAANRLRNLNRLLGGLNVALAAITATAMYAALNQKLNNLNPFEQLLIVGIAILPAIAFGLQKEWQITTREKGHLALARDCRSLQKQMEYKLAFPPANLREDFAPWHERYSEVIARPILPLG